MWKTASILVGAVLILMTIGLVMLASTSGVRAAQQFGDELFFVKRQLLWLMLGGLAGIVAARLPYAFWRAAAVPFALFTVLLLILVLIPGIGKTVKGSSRWLRLGFVTFQPSEIAKLSICVLLAWWMERVRRRSANLLEGVAIPIFFLGLFLGLIFIEPDFGTTLLVAVVGMALIFLGGARIGPLLVIATAGLSAFSFAIMKNPERMRRIVAFLNPEKYQQNEAYQLLNAIYAFVIGGAGGVGLGAGMQKLYYLPEAHTDFIFAILGEELGLFATLSVVILFLVIFICGILISLSAPDLFGRLLASGITLTITLQAAINIGVVTGCLPTKGLALPFISFGGTSMVMSLAMVGLLVNIAMNYIGEEEDETGRIRDSIHDF